MMREMLSVMIATYNEEKNIEKLIYSIRQQLSKINQENEIIVADANSRDRTREIAEKARVKVFVRKDPRFGSFLKEGIQRAKGDYIITMDSDFSHDPKYLIDLWNHRNDADIIIASRWIQGGGSNQSPSRIFLSKRLNGIYNLFLKTGVKDLNSNFRIYHKKIFSEINLDGKEFDILPELIVKAKRNGFSTKEIPFFFNDRKRGKSKMKILKHTISYLKKLIELSFGSNGF